jgi:hypothetical protein
MVCVLLVGLSYLSNLIFIPHRENPALLERIPEPAINRAAQILLDLRETWENSTKEERKDLVHIMIQEVGVDVEIKRVLWVKARPDYEPLFSILYGLRPDPGRRYWIKGHGAEVDIGDMGEVMGQIATEIKIAFPVSHKVLTSVEEYVQ